MKILKSIYSFFLIGAVLFSSIGFSVSQHYCMGMLKSEKFYSLAEQCAFESSHVCGLPSSDHITHGCCDTELMAIPGIQYVKNLADDEQDFDDFTAFVAYSEIDLEALPETDLNKIYIPHDRETYRSGKSILIQHQRFLI